MSQPLRVPVENKPSPNYRELALRAHENLEAVAAPRAAVLGTAVPGAAAGQRRGIAGASPKTESAPAYRTQPRDSASPDPLGGLRSIVRDSWIRSLAYDRNPDGAGARLLFADDELTAYRDRHPLALIMPVIEKLLIQHCQDTGLLVAVGDEHGRLLWVDGDASMRRRAESMLFVAGTDWSERQVGTSAPGTALALGHGVQIAGPEHFSRAVHSWSCTAVPLHDPDSGAVLGVVDITGMTEAVAPHTLALVEATVAAAEAHLQIERLRSGADGPLLTGAEPGYRDPSLGAPVKRASQRRADGPARNGASRKSLHRGSPHTVTFNTNNLYKNSLQILGRDTALLSVDGAAVELSLRHGEILTLLALHPAGLSAAELSDMLYPCDAGTATLRAEMVRLRKVLCRLNPAAVPESRPYRLPLDLVVDSRQVLNYLLRGAHRMAQQIYHGPILPRSEAPAIVQLRRQASAVLRQAMLGDASVEVLFEYAQLPEAADDVEVWGACLQLLPARSPRRAAVVANLERIGR